MLEIDNIHTYYGKSHVIQGISMEVRKGELVSLLGRNGAGKTTTLRSIMNLNSPKSGSIRYDGADIAGRKPFEVSRAGIGYVPEERRIFSALTVLENLNIGIRNGKSRQWNSDRVFSIFPNLAARRKNRGNELSGGEQQMLAIGRALMANPSLLLLDEPTEGLAPIMVEHLVDVIGMLKEEGLTILLVEQNVKSTFKVADRHYILQQGKIVYQSSNEELMKNDEVLVRYLSV